MRRVARLFSHKEIMSLRLKQWGYQECFDALYLPPAELEVSKMTNVD